jgi:hypothetical protein
MGETELRLRLRLRLRKEKELSQRATDLPAGRQGTTELHRENQEAKAPHLGGWGVEIKEE